MRNRMIIMENEKHYLSKNVKRLMALRGIPSLTQLAARSAGEITTRTLGGLVNYPDDNNPTVGTLQTLASVFKVPVWTLVSKDFPFEALKQSNNIKSISADGYALLHIYESATDEQRKSLLDYASYQMRGSAAESKVRDVQSRYLPSPINAPARYKGCSEDHDK